jgi:hypothetical protein
LFKVGVQALPALQAPKVGALGDAGAIAGAKLALQDTEELLLGFGETPINCGLGACVCQSMSA